MKKRIVLCADDYGQAPTISQGILDLVKQSRLSAVSCMVTTPYWHEHAKWLLPYREQIDIGLHFNLTEGEGAFSLSQLMAKSLLRRLDQAALVKSLHSQLDQFENNLGFLPDFIDGHQHVHQFPMVREALLRVYDQRLKRHQPYVRLVEESFSLPDGWRNFKRAVVYLMGTRALKVLLKKHHIPYNADFAGIYDFSQAPHYPQLFPQFLAKIQDRGLIMCHPGLAPLSIDPIGKARSLEYQYLTSTQFDVDCEEAGARLIRFGNHSI